MPSYSPPAGALRRRGGMALEGDHYRRTAEDWPANYDTNAGPLRAILRRAYGDAATLWMRRWRLFFLATA